MTRLTVLVRNRLSGGAVGAARLMGQGAWAIIDQGLFAVSNFVLNVLLARWLSPAEYGAYTVAYAAFLLLGTAHSALLTEPMLVFGAGRYREAPSAYLSVLLRLHWRGTLAAAGLTALLIWAYQGLTGDGFMLVVVALAIVGPTILFQWLMRRSFYMRFEPRSAAIAGMIYFPLVIGAAIVLSRTNTLSPVSALAAMGGASLVSGGWLWLRSGARTAVVAKGLTPTVMKEHWVYGRWALAASALSWIPGNVFYVLLPVWGGLEATAALRAVTNLALPVLHLVSAVGTILLPTFVRTRETGSLRKLALGTVAAFAAGWVVYYVMVVALRRPLVAWLFGGTYDAYAGLVWILGALPLAAAMTAVAGDVLRARERPDRVFWAYVASTTVAMTLGLAAMSTWGVQGAAIGLLLSSLATGATMALFLRFSPSKVRP